MVDVEVLVGASCDMLADSWHNRRPDRSCRRLCGESDDGAHSTTCDAAVIMTFITRRMCGEPTTSKAQLALKRKAPQAMMKKNLGEPHVMMIMYR